MIPFARDSELRGRLIPGDEGLTWLEVLVALVLISLMVAVALLVLNRRLDRLQYERNQDAWGRAGRFYRVWCRPSQETYAAGERVFLDVEIRNIAVFVLD